SPAERLPVLVMPSDSHGRKRFEIIIVTQADSTQMLPVGVRDVLWQGPPVLPDGFLDPLLVADILLPRPDQRGCVLEELLRHEVPVRLRQGGHCPYALSEA